MRKKIAVGILTLITSVAAAKDFRVSSSLVAQTKLVKSVHQQPEYSIARVYFSPAEPRQGDKVTTFIELATDFESHKEVRSIVALKINGQNIKTIYRNGTLWTSEAFLLNGQELRNFEVSLYIENVKSSERVRSDLLILKKEIQQLNIQIAQETNSMRKAQLEYARDQKLIQKADLEATLESMKRVVAVKSVDLTVNPVNPSPTLPEIHEVDPAIGQPSGAESLVVSGINLSSVSKVSIGGIEIPATDYVLTETTIEFTAPVLPVGMHEILIEAVTNGQTVTSKIKNAFYVLTPSSSSGVVYPVAFAGLPLNTPVDTGVQLDGSQSYSADGATLTYQWSVVSKPQGASILDGVIDQPTIVNPNFVAATPGNYVVSLVVSNGEKSSVPSLTVVTVGPKDPVTLTPSLISGIAQKDGIYIGVFQACNNLQKELPYQIYNSKRVVFISGTRRGILTRGNCVHFQFSVHVSDTDPLLIEDIPFVVRGDIPFSKVIRLEVEPARASALNLQVSFPTGQWDGERDLESISLTGSVPLYGTFNEQSATPIVVKNTGFQTYLITNAPTITHLSGASGIFSTDFPVEGLTIPPGGSATFNILVSPGNFGGRTTAMALFEWDTGDELEGSKVVMLNTYKLLPPRAYSYVVNMGTKEVGQSLDAVTLIAPQNFFNSEWFSGLGQVESVSISEDAGGSFTLMSEFSGPTMVGSIDYIKASGVNLYPNFLNTTAGNFQGKVQVKLKGYQNIFEFIVNATFTEPETP